MTDADCLPRQLPKLQRKRVLRTGLSCSS